MNFRKYKEHAPFVLRISMSFVILWFGLTNIFNPQYLVGYLPKIAYSLPIEPLTLLLINGIFEVIFGLLLLVGLFTRVVSLVLFLHILIIMFGVGYNDIAVRDFGLALATFVIFLNGPDKFCLDKKLKR